MLASCKKLRFAAFVIAFYSMLGGGVTNAQSGSSTSVIGTVVDQTGAVVPNASVDLRNRVSAFDRTTATDGSGKFAIPNVPFNPYHLSVAAKGFAHYAQDIDVRSVVPVDVNISLKVTGSSEVVTVEGGAEDLLENDPTFHTDVDKSLFDKLPLESQSSSLSSLVTLATPGIAADSNGLFHGLGDHAENSFSVDGQPITDQQSKVFSNQIPMDSIESMEVIDSMAISIFTRTLKPSGVPFTKFIRRRKTMFARNTSKISAVLLLIVVVSLAACAPAATPAPAPVAAPTNAPAAPVAKAVTLQIVQNDKLGKFVADGDGRTLYLFTQDAPNVSNCYDKCATAWPPLLIAGQPTLKDGVSTTAISTTVRTDGSIQLTYNGWPLYFWFKDKAPGDTTGQAVAKTWWVVSGEGNPIKPETIAITQTDKLGKFLVDGNGFTLYAFTKDTKDTSTCYDKCEQAWAPILTVGQPTLGDGTTASMVGSAQRKDGSMQVTYNGMPLYYFAKDHAAGDTNGQAIGSVWYVVTPDGQTMK